MTERMNSEPVLLLVDDEVNIVSSLTRLLRKEKYKILKAHSGEEALDIMEDTRVDVILTDQRMPGMSGIQFLNKVKEKYPQTVRLMLSGYTELDSVTEAINKGSIYKFLTKPWDDELIKNNIAEAFEYHSLKSRNIFLQEQLEKANIELKTLSEWLENTLSSKEGELDAYLVSLRNYQNAFEQIPVAVLGIDNEGKIVLINPSAERLFEDGNSLFLQKNYNEALPESLATEIAGVLSGEKQHSEVNVAVNGQTGCLCSIKSFGVYNNISGAIVTLFPE